MTSWAKLWYYWAKHNIPNKLLEREREMNIRQERYQLMSHIIVI